MWDVNGGMVVNIAFMSEIMFVFYILPYVI